MSCRRRSAGLTARLRSSKAAAKLSIPISMSLLYQECILTSSYMMWIYFLSRLLELVTPRHTDQTAIHTWLVLMKAHRTLARHATRSIEAVDMCLSDFGILEALLHKGPQSVKDLGRRIELTSGAMTAAIDPSDRPIGGTYGCNIITLPRERPTSLYLGCS